MKEEHLQVRRRHGPTMAERLKWHLGSIVAVLALIALGLQVAGLFLGPEEEATAAADEVGRTIQRVQSVVAARPFAADERSKALDEQIGALRTSLKYTPTAVDAGEGLTYPPAWLKTLKVGETNEIRFGAPVGLTAAAEAGGIGLKWAEPAENNLKAGAFEVFRKEGAGEPAKVMTVEGAAHEARDATAKPGRAYEYTVVAVAADPDIANTPRGRSAPSAPAAVKAMAGFKLDLVEVKDKVASIKVTKWHGEAWRDRTFEVREGEAIGQMDQALNIDFSTGRTLARLVVETSESPVSRDEIVFDGKGKVVLDSGAPRRVTVSRTESHRKHLASITGADLPDETLELDER
jgi:hypothetical protein